MKKWLKNIFLTAVVSTALFMLFACNQKLPDNAVLKISNIEIAGKSVNQDNLERGSAKIDVENGRFGLKISAKLYKVKISLIANGEIDDITEQVVNGKTQVCSFNGSAGDEKKYEIVFKNEEGKILKHYKFTAVYKLKSDSVLVLKKLAVNGQSVSIANEMTVEVDSYSERVSISVETANNQNVIFDPPLEDGKFYSPFNQKSLLQILVSDGYEENYYKLFVTVRKFSPTEFSDNIALKTLTVNNEKVLPISNEMHVFVPNDAAEEIPITASAFNDAEVTFDPPLNNGTINLGLVTSVRKMRITSEKAGYPSMIYSLTVERRRPRAELKSISVNGYSIALDEEMNYELSCGRDEAVIDALGKVDTNITFTPPLSVGNKIAIAPGQTVDLVVTVKKQNCEDSNYKLKLHRADAPAAGSPSRLEGVLIAPGHNQEKFFQTISKEFPAVEDSAIYAIEAAKDYTLKVNRIWQDDVVEVKVNGKIVNVSKTEGHSLFYNISLEEIAPKESSKQDVEISVVEKNMQSKTFALSMCYDGSLAEGIFIEAEYGNEVFRPYFSDVNFIPNPGYVKLSVIPADKMSVVKTSDNEDFPIEFPVNETSVTKEFTLTTISGKKLTRQVTFKAAAEAERAYLESIYFYPEKPQRDYSGYSFKLYKNQLNPRFNKRVYDYTLNLVPGTHKLFADFVPVVKDSSLLSVKIDGNDVTKEVYYNNLMSGESISFYSFEVLPDEEKTLTVTVTSDRNISKTYTIKIISPTDEQVTDFDVEFLKDGKPLLAVTPIGTGGLRLPPQDYTEESISFKIKPGADGMHFGIAKYIQKDKDEFEKVEDIPLSQNAKLNLTTGLNILVIEAKSRDESKIERRVFEVYKFTKDNKVWFNINDNELIPTHYMLLSGKLTSPVQFKGFGKDVRFALTALDKDDKQMKIDRLSDSEFTIHDKPKIIMVGVIMPDEVKLYYAILVE